MAEISAATIAAVGRSSGKEELKTTSGRPNGMYGLPTEVWSDEI